MNASASMTMTPSEYAETADHLMAAKIYSLAACVMLFYDMALTFGDEVEKIWKQRFTGATFLWLLNRYINPLGYIVVIVSFHQRWAADVCNRYILYPEILKTITDTVIGAIFILRLYSIYSRSHVILFAFIFLLLGEIATKIWSFTDGVPLQLPPGLVGCILTGQSDNRFIWTWVVELIFDSCVFFATLIKAVKLYRELGNSTASVLIRIMLRDGVIYFAAIFGSNLITVVFLLVATPDIKAINATFSNMLTSLMVSRLMLNLRIGNDAEKRLSGTAENFRSTIIRDFTPKMKSPRSFEDTVIGNLGAGVSFWTDDDEHEEVEEETQDSNDVFELAPRHNHGGSHSQHPFAVGPSATPYYRDW